MYDWLRFKSYSLWFLFVLVTIEIKLLKEITKSIGNKLLITRF